MEHLHVLDFTLKNVKRMIDTQRQKDIISKRLISFGSHFVCWGCMDLLTLPKMNLLWTLMLKYIFRKLFYYTLSLFHTFTASTLQHSSETSSDLFDGSRQHMFWKSVGLYLSLSSQWFFLFFWIILKYTPCQASATVFTCSVTVGLLMSY